MNAGRSNLRVLLVAAESRTLNGSNQHKPIWSANRQGVVLASGMRVRPRNNHELSKTGRGIHPMRGPNSPRCKIVGPSGTLGSKLPQCAPAVRTAWDGPKIAHGDQARDHPVARRMCDQHRLFRADPAYDAALAVNLTHTPLVFARVATAAAPQG
jgi:hypothetical protein